MIPSDIYILKNNIMKPSYTCTLTLYILNTSEQVLCQTGHSTNFCTVCQGKTTYRDRTTSFYRKKPLLVQIRQFNTSGINVYWITHRNGKG